jgi:hypothetical protein
MTRFICVAIACVLLVGCATTQTPPVDVTGTWTGQWPAIAGVIPLPMVMTLKQVGTDVTGTLTVPAVPAFNATVTGTVSGNRFSWRTPTSGGQATIQGNSMEGTSNGGGRVKAQRQ